MQATIKFHAFYPTGWSLLYKYAADLLCLQFPRPLLPHNSHALSKISTALNVEAWSRALATHPDQAFARYVRDGLRSGLRIGFKYGSPFQSATANMPSALRHLYLQTELAKSFPSPDGLPPLFGDIPKGHNTGKWRLVTDLSFPHGRSINDGIDGAISSLSYISVDDIAAAAAQLGPGVLLAKVDIE